MLIDLKMIPGKTYTGIVPQGSDVEDLIDRINLEIADAADQDGDSQESTPQICVGANDSIRVNQVEADLTTILHEGDVVQISAKIKGN